MAGTTLEFPAELITDIWEDVEASDPEEFRRAELRFLSDNQPLAELQRTIFAASHTKYGEQEAYQCARGYLAGHRILRATAASLPARPPRAIDSYMKLIGSDADRLPRDFRRDYGHHEPIQELVERGMEQTPAVQYGARLIFALHGSLANPNREPIDVIAEAAAISRVPVTAHRSARHTTSRRSFAKR